MYIMKEKKCPNCGRLFKVSNKRKYCNSLCYLDAKNIRDHKYYEVHRDAKVSKS